LPGLRRVVTGHKGSLGVVQSDTLQPSEELSMIKGVWAGPIWATDAVPTNDNNVDVDGGTRKIAGAGGIVMTNGTNCRWTDLAPGAIAHMARHILHPAPSHRTPSVDLNILIQGELVLILDDGSETHLSTPGDTVVQRGTMHAWKNPGKTWTRWVTTVIDATPIVLDGK
ncbi:hypothetical protein OF83DRAFT_1027099, partial [Amylostereum chailletii]